MADDLAPIHDQVATASSNNLKRSRWIVLGVGILTALMIGLSTFLQFYAAEKWLPSHIVGMTVSILALLLSVGLVVTNKDSAEEIDAARQALRAAEKKDKELASQLSDHALKSQALRAEVDLATRELNEANQMLEGMRWMQESIEQSIDQPNTSVVDAITRTLTAGEPWLKRSLNFEARQHYTIDIYEARKLNGAPQLHLVAYIRSNKCDMAKARTWGLGDGVAGHCLARNRSVIISNASDPSVASLVVQNSTDLDTYQSFAAFPIRAGKPDELWGVVVATNSDPYYYDASEPDNRGATSTAGRIKLLAGLMGLVVQIHGTRSGGGPGQEPQAAVNLASHSGHKQVE